MTMIVLCAGCAPGVLHWPGGSEPIRSVLFYSETLGSTDGRQGIAHRAMIALSTSTIQCDPISPGDDWKIAEADFVTALGREGAKHILLELYKTENSAWEGQYNGTDEPDFSTLVTDTETQRIASGDYLSIDEAKVTDEDGLIRLYQPTAITVNQMDASSWVDIDYWLDGLDGDLTGSFSFGNSHISGTIRRASLCTSTSIAFSILEGCADVDLLPAAEDADEDDPLDILSICTDTDDFDF